METKIKELEKLSNQIENEKNFEKLVDIFARATELIKQSISGTSQCKGRLLEIIKDMDKFIEVELDSSFRKGGAPTGAGDLC